MSSSEGMTNMTTLEDICLSTCLKSNIEIPIQYIRNVVSYGDFIKMLIKHDKCRWHRMIQVINESKMMMVKEAFAEDWSNEKWREEVQNLKHDCLRNYYAY